MNKIGIFLPGGHGDVMTAMSVLQYKGELWPGREIVWYCTDLEAECLRHAPLEVREWEDFSPFIYGGANNGGANVLNQEIKKHYPSLADVEIGYFPGPWMYDHNHIFRRSIDLPNISKKVFGIPQDYEWHPKLYFSQEERDMVKDFCLSLPHPKTIMLETGSRSGQSRWTDNMTQNTIKLCREKLGKCNFIFASKQDQSPQEKYKHKYDLKNYNDKLYDNFFDDSGMVSCSHFTIRQAALVNNYSDLFIGISSGLSVATSCWGNKPTPKLQYVNSFICSTVSLANGPIELVEIHSPMYNPEQEYYNKLSKLLEQM